MGYIGATPSNAFINNDVQRVTNSTNNYVDLDHNISSLDSVIVFVNNVRQESTNLTFTSASRITLGDTLQNSDVVEIVFIGKAVATQSAAANSITNSMLAGSIANSKLANSSITLNGSAVSLGGSATVGGNNTPAFAVKISGGDHSISNATNTVVRFGAEDFDTDSAYDTSNYRFVVPSGKSGKYFFSSRIYMEYGNNANEIGRLQICKNGNAMAIFGGLANGTENQGKSLSVDTILDLAESDYVEVKIYHNQGGTQPIDDDTDFSYFYGYKLL